MLSIEQIQSVFKNSPEAHLILYPDAPNFTIAGVNGSFLGHPELNNDITGRGIFEVFRDSSENSTIKTALEQAVSLKKSSSGIEIKNFGRHVQSGKNTGNTWECSLYPIIDSSGKTQFIVINFTEAKEVLFPVYNENTPYAQQVSNILESITDSVFAVDKDWTVTYWNKEAERISGLSRDVIIGKNLWKIFNNEVTRKFYSEYQRAMHDNIEVRFEEYAPTLNIWIEAAAFPTSSGLLVYFKDISHRKNNEELIEKERQKYQSLFNSSPLPMWVYDMVTLRFLDVNEAAINHYGYTREEFLVLTIKDIRPKEDVPQLKSILKNLSLGHTNKSAVRHSKKSGEIIFVNIESDAIEFEGKNARIVTAADITEKLAVEQALQASEKRFKALALNSSDLISIQDKEGRCIYVSPAIKSALGIEPKFFIGKSIFDFIQKEDHDRVYRQFYNLKPGKQIKVSPFRFQAAKRTVWIETIFTNMAEDPAVGGIVSNASIVTDRIENENRIRESIERYTIVSKATSDAIWDWDMKTGNIKWNRGIKGIFGYETPPSTQTDAIDCVHPDDKQRLLDNLQSHIENKQSRLKIEYRFRCADGTYKHVLDRAFLQFEKGGTPIRMIGAMQDITEQINYIQAIEEQNRRLEEISWIQSHIVRAPLARIMGLSKTLSDNLNNEAIMQELLRYLDNSADELDIVIRDIISKTSTE